MQRVHRRGIRRMHGAAEAPTRLVSGLLRCRHAAMARDSHIGSCLGKQHAGDAADRTGATEYQHALARIVGLVRLVEPALHGGNECCRGSVRPARIRQNRYMKRREHRLASRIEHIGCHDRIAAPDEKCRPRRSLGTARKNRILR